MGRFRTETGYTTIHEETSLFKEIWDEMVLGCSEHGVFAHTDHARKRRTDADATRSKPPCSLRYAPLACSRSTPRRWEASTKSFSELKRVAVRFAFFIPRDQEDLSVPQMEWRIRLRFPFGTGTLALLWVESVFNCGR